MKYISFKKDLTEVKELFHAMYSLSYFVKFHNNDVLHLFYLLMLTDSKTIQNQSEEHYARIKF